MTKMFIWIVMLMAALTSLIIAIKMECTFRRKIKRLRRMNTFKIHQQEAKKQNDNRSSTL